MKITKIQEDILRLLNCHGMSMTYVIKNILSNDFYGFNHGIKLKTQKVRLALCKLETAGLVSKVSGKANPYKTQLKWMLTPMRDRA